MSLLFAGLLATSVAEIDLGPAAFRLRGVDPLLMAEHRSFELLLVGVPDAETRGALENIERLRGEGADAQQLSMAETKVLTDLAQRRFTPGIQQQEQRVRLALLAAGVTHWRPAGGSWRPVRIKADGELVEGDGLQVPDEIPVWALPGAASVADVLKDEVLRLSGLSDEVRQRVSRFRGAAGASPAPGPDGSPVRPPPV